MKFIKFLYQLCVLAAQSNKLNEFNFLLAYLYALHIYIYITANNYFPVLSIITYCSVLFSGIIIAYIEFFMDTLSFDLIDIAHEMSCTLHGYAPEDLEHGLFCASIHPPLLLAHCAGPAYSDGTPLEQLTLFILSVEYILKFWLCIPIHFFFTTFDLLCSVSQSTLVEINTEWYNRYNGGAILTMWGQLMSIAILTIWARGVGPRFRPDQLSDLTWKDLLLFLGSLLCTVIIIIQ